MDLEKIIVQFYMIIKNIEKFNGIINKADYDWVKVDS